MNDALLLHYLFQPSFKMAAGLVSKGNVIFLRKYYILHCRLNGWV